MTKYNWEDHDVNKVCEPQDAEKYLAIVNERKGKQKLVCYAALVLGRNNVSTYLPNIVVAVWIMYPEIEYFQLNWFKNIPDTDNIARYVNLHGRPEEDNYLIGGNPDRSGANNPFVLTPKGREWAEEVEQKLTGKMVIVKHRAKESKDVIKASYDEKMSRIIKSALFSKFIGELENSSDSSKIMTDYKISKEELCATLGIYYPQTGKGDPYSKKKKDQCRLFADMIAKAGKDGINVDKSKEILLFIKWMEGVTIV